MLEIIFYLINAILIYTYFIYPVIVYIFSNLLRKKVDKNENFFPYVSLIITAYNEEKIIRKKLENTLLLKYPKEKLEIIVVSDGSTDKTNQIVNEYKNKGIKLLALNKNCGKTVAQNEAVKIANGEIIIFSDANSMYNYDAINKIVRNFNDPLVGCVCGELRYINTNSNASGKGEGLYWKYEQFLKRSESRLGNILGANGSIYAVRKSLYIPLPPEIISDFIEPLLITSNGYRSIYEPEAICYEEPSKSYENEFKRKVRIITRSYRGLLYVKYLLNPLRYGFLSVCLISHKLLRWFTGFLMLILFSVNILLLVGNPIYKTTLLLQILFYLLSYIGFKCKSNIKLFFIPAYFCMVNLASIKGIIQFYLGDKAISWQPER